MSRLFLTPINLNQNEYQNAVVQNLGTAPASPKNGQIYYDTTALTTLQWNGSAWVNPLSRGNHIGTQLAATISNFAATAQSYALNLFAAPTANVPMGGFTLTGLASPTAAGQAATFDWTLARSLSSFTGALTANIAMSGYTLTGLGTPTGAGQAAEFAWVQAQIQAAAAGISSKDPVAAVSTVNIATLSGTTTIDGVALVAGNRVLLTAQTTASQNGPLIVSAGAWTRPITEGAATAELDLGALWLALAGTIGAGTQWRMSNSAPVTPGTTAVSIVQFSAASIYSSGNGISLTGSAFSANVVAGGGILSSASGLQVDTAVVTRKFSQTFGDGSTTSYIVTHGLGTQDVVMAVRQAATPFSVIECDMAATSTTTCTLAFATAPAASSMRLTVLA